jgi:isoleucyl-tRNA synthetase
MADGEPPAEGPNLVEVQARVQGFWDRTGLPARLLGGREDGPVFRFTEGPPTANGRPHLGHVVARALKDAILRYHRMRGERIVSPMAGWDCHGLPVELEIEKKHGMRSRREIEAYGVARFCDECRAGALEVADVWTAMSARMAYWLAYDRPYRTMDAPYIESVWWALRTLYDRGLLEPGHYCLPYCPRCETSLSSHEVAQGYREATDPSVTLRLRLHGAPGAAERFLLVWTTTPWTLPANLLVAARAELTYVGIRGEDGAEYLVAEAAAARYFPAGAEVRQRYTGRDLADHRYDPPFPFAGPGPRRYRVVLDDSVDPNEGTGFVHIAPSFGPEDQRIGEREGVGLFDPLDGRAVFTDAVGPVAGRSFKAADPILLELLREGAQLFRSETVRHTYPFCWRCATPLIYRVVDAWFVRTRRLTDRLVRYNAGVRWVPEHLRDGRFGNFLAEAKDWALSRNRYWGTPLPIWSCPAGHRLCVGSFAELARQAGGALPEPFDPHRVTVDALRLACPECGAAMAREPYTIDGWFDSGCAPFAQYHYPFAEGPFDPAAPLDAVAEGLDQTRGWFYTLLVVATALFDRPAYRVSVASGLVLDEEGQKMSKSKGNAIEPLALLDRLGGDAVRWTFYVTDFTEPMRLSDTTVRLAGQRTLGTLLNVLAFYRENALPDGATAADDAPVALLDRWLLARLAESVEHVTASLASYEMRGGALALQQFVSDLSTWYLRRSRGRFWAEGATPERRAADATMRRTLGTLARLLAPYAPFTSEHLFQLLGDAPYADGSRSVHAEGWPAGTPGDPAVIEAMASLRARVESGRELRQRAGVKARFPLPALVVRAPRDDPVRALGPEGEALIRDELNVEELRWEEPESAAAHPEPEWIRGTASGGVELFLRREPTPAMYREGLAREALRRLQTARKELRLGYTEPIALELWSSGTLLDALRERRERLARELLAEELALAELPAPAADGVRRWEFAGSELVARLRRRS